jgi:hypothetical protein
MQRYVAVAGVLVVIAFLVFAKTASQTRKGKEIRGASIGATGTSSGGTPGPGAAGAGMGGGGPIGGGDGAAGPPAGPPGSGRATLSGAVAKTVIFKQVTCISSPSSKNGLSATGITDPASPTPVFLSVNTDGSTINPLLLRLTPTDVWTDGQLKIDPATTRKGKTITFTGRVLPQGKTVGKAIQITGTMTCGKISTVIG